ncbi:MAG: polyphosphate polymerase domain-containing protein [Bryobacterales bacterium]|nr:polyphosphate polymerase domain-containing protein [Bryobacterales bacterium]
MEISRYEFKYHIPPDRLPELRRYLLRYCDADVNSRGDWYPIYSLYLDNDRYKMYRDTEDGAPWRMKLRVRGYANAEAPVKLEVKRRMKDQVRKTSALVSPADWAGIQRTTDLFQLRQRGEFVQFTESLRAAPKMLVSYERLAFSSKVDDYVRVTFDRRMRCQPMSDWSLAGQERGWRNVDDPASLGGGRSVYLMELKFVLAPPAWLRDMVNHFELQRRGYSKYGRAVRRWVFERESAWDLCTSRRIA